MYAQQDATISCPTVDSGNKFAHTLKAYPAEVSYSKQENFYKIFVDARMQNSPENLITITRVPQNRVLAEFLRNVKIFINHHFCHIDR